MDDRATSIEKRSEYRGKRHAFSLLGPVLREGTVCFVCGGVATIRHHVKPLILGGDNKFNNLVALCHKCHMLVHEVGPREPILEADEAGGKRIQDLLRSMYS